MFLKGLPGVCVPGLLMLLACGDGTPDTNAVFQAFCNKSEECEPDFEDAQADVCLAFLSNAEAALTPEDFTLYVDTLSECSALEDCDAVATCLDESGVVDEFGDRIEAAAYE